MYIKRRLYYAALNVISITVNGQLEIV